MLEYLALCNGWGLSIQYPNCHRFAILYPTAGLPNAESQTQAHFLTMRPNWNSAVSWPQPTRNELLVCHCNGVILTHEGGPAQI